MVLLNMTTTNFSLYHMLIEILLLKKIELTIIIFYK